MKLTKEFKKIAGDLSIIDAKEEKVTYSHDIGDLPSLLTNTLFNIYPYFIIQPENEEDIKKALRFCEGLFFSSRHLGIAGCNGGEVLSVYSKQYYAQIISSLQHENKVCISPFFINPYCTPCITNVSGVQRDSHLSECSCSNDIRLRLAAISLQARS